MTTPFTYFIFAGEASGDLHGSHLMQALKKNSPDSSFYGVGGPRMRNEGLNSFLRMEEFQVMGLTDVLKAFPRLYKYFYQVRNHVLGLNPDCVILIDYPGFNLRLAKSLRKQGFKGKLVQYICPTVWAHGKHRIQTIETCYDLLLTIFPFEASFFNHNRLKVEYIGNPLLNTLLSHDYQPNWKSLTGLPSNSQIIALFPGSRVSEISKHVPIQLQMAEELILNQPHLHFALSCAHEDFKPFLLDHISKKSTLLQNHLSLIPPKFHYDLMKGCHAALAKSGTVTLELALHKVPTVVHFEVSPLNYLYAKYILKLRLPYYCIVNILSNSSVFPEFIAHSFTSQDIKKELENILLMPSRYECMQNDCEKLIQQLSQKTSSHQSAARAILELMRC